MEKVLVTGGAGFIGSHLCEALIEKGYFVYCLDMGNEENIKKLKDNPNFEFIKADVVNPLSHQSLAINYIFQLASPASPADFSKIPEEIALTNSLGTLNVLKLAEKTKARVLIASTSEVYGDPKEHPQKETYWGNVNSFGPRSCYDESKRFGETLTYIYLQKHGINARIVRIFNTYGPKMRKDDGRAVSNFINQALEGKEITIYGDGESTRCFCYVADMVEGLMKLMFGDNTKGEVVNIGNTDEYKVIDLAKKIKDLTGSKSEIVFKPALPDDPLKRKPDITKAKNLLGWEPKVSLEEGLKKTILYYQKLT